MPRGKRNTPFQPGHSLFYALRPVSRDPESNVVTSVACRFCEKFGREEKVGAKRRATQHVKHFKQPFRTENYHQHHLGQHPARWSDYQVLPNDRKSAYLSLEGGAFHHIDPVVNNPPVHPQNTNTQPVMLVHPPVTPAFARPVHIEPPLPPLKFLVDKTIVDVVVTDLLFDPTQESVAKDQLMAPFTSLHEAMSDYIVNITNPKLLNLVTTHVSLGASPKLTATLLAETAKSTSSSQLPSLDECTPPQVSALIRCVFAYNYQALADIMRCAWAFSVSFSRVNLSSTYFIDVRIRVSQPHHPIASYHLISLPPPDRFNWETSFSTLIRLLDTLQPDKWRQHLVGVVTDGFEHTDGATYILVDRFRNEAAATVYRTWSAANPLDSVIKRVHASMLDGLFFDTLLHLIAYLRRQPSLLTQLNGRCPKLVSTHWLCLERCLKWVKTHRITILRYLQEKKPACQPSMSWWILAMAAFDFTQIAAKTYHKLCAMTSAVSRHVEFLTQLLQTFNRMSGCKGPVSDDELGLLGDWDFIEDQKYVIRKSAVRNFLNGLGSFVHLSINELAPPALDDLVQKVGIMFLAAIVRISAVIVERENSNMGSARLPAVLPVELAKITRASFNNDVRSQANRLGKTMDSTEIEMIEEQFGQFLDTYHDEHSIQRTFNSPDNQTDFESAWANLKTKFDKLHIYCAGIATAFPDVCRDFIDTPVLPWESDVFRESAKDFAIEACMHCKQHTELFDAVESIAD